MSDDKFINDIITLKWLTKEFYEKANTSLNEKEIRMMRSLEDKYAPTDVTQMLLDAYAALQAECERLKEVVKWNLQNNDEFGCEFLGITIVRNENKMLRELLGEALDRIEHYKMRDYGSTRETTIVMLDKIKKLLED